MKHKSFFCIFTLAILLAFVYIVNLRSQTVPTTKPSDDSEVADESQKPLSMEKLMELPPEKRDEILRQASEAMRSGMGNFTPEERKRMDENKRKRDEQQKELAKELEKLNVTRIPNYEVIFEPPSDQKWGDFTQGESISLWNDKLVYGFSEPIVIYGQSRYREDSWVFDATTDICYRYDIEVEFVPFDQFAPRRFPVKKTIYGEGYIPPQMGRGGYVIHAGSVSHATCTYINRHFDMTLEGMYFIRARSKNSSDNDDRPRAVSNELKIIVINAVSTTPKK